MKNPVLIHFNESGYQRKITAYEEAAKYANSFLAMLEAAFPGEPVPDIAAYNKAAADPAGHVAARVHAPAGISIRRAIEADVLEITAEQKKAFDAPPQIQLDEQTYVLKNGTVDVKPEAVERTRLRYSTFATEPEQIARFEFWQTAQQFAQQQGISLDKLIRHGFLRRGGRTKVLEHPDTKWILEGKNEMAPY